MLQHLGITQPLVSASKSPLNRLGPSSPSGGNAKSPPGTVDPGPRLLCCLAWRDPVTSKNAIRRNTQTISNAEEIPTSREVRIRHFPQSNDTSRARVTDQFQIHGSRGALSGTFSRSCYCLY